MEGFIQFLNNLLGTYTPIVNETGTIPAGMAGVDWPYIIRAVVFIIVLWSIFRILGGMICKT